MLRCVAERRPLPPTFADAPELWQGQELFLAAFWELDNDRPRGDGVYPIPRSAIKTWLDEYVGSDDPEVRDDVYYFVRQLDLKYLEIMHERIESRRNEERISRGFKSELIR